MASADPIRAALERLVAAGELAQDCINSLDWWWQMDAAIKAARAALAEKQGEGPSDEEIISEAIWGHHPAPPAEGEVGELVNMLTGIAYWKRHGKPGKGDPSPFDIRQADRLTRATELLQQQHPTPVPVSERPILKSSPFNDAEGRCWCGTAGFADNTGDLTVEYPPSWELRMPQPQDDCVVAAHALPLPLPQGEVE